MFLSYKEAIHRKYGDVASLLFKLLLLLLSIVPLKFVYDNDVDVLDKHSEEYAGFVRAIVSQIGIIAKLMAAPPLYRLYNNKLSRDFVKNEKVYIYIPPCKNLFVGKQSEPCTLKS